MAEGPQGGADVPLLQGASPEGPPAPRWKLLGRGLGWLRGEGPPREGAPPRKEFGGGGGVLLIMAFSHVLPYYLLGCLEQNHGCPLGPATFAKRLPRILWHARPTGFSVCVYLGFILVEGVLAAVMPGVVVKGRPIPPDGRQLSYLCNGLTCWYFSLVLVTVLHFSRLLPLSSIVENYGALLTTAVLFADAVSVALYVAPLAAGSATRMTGNPLYDFFMGAALNPRLGPVDLKMFAEIRVSWMLLFLLTLSAFKENLEHGGSCKWNLSLVLIAHGLYTNACMKGEELIPMTWDIFHEKFGFMLIFWNLAGVPFVYCFPSLYIAGNPQQVLSSPWYSGALLAVLLAAYYVWDTANSQKNRFRAQQMGLPLRGVWAFPQLPWGTLRDPKWLDTASGSKLLISGWWGMARKIHYTSDFVMSMVWALACGFGSPLPYVYPVFFLVMITHRVVRDEARCKQKYGSDWERYKAAVPHLFIPGVF